MAWTITNWANADWSAAAILNEFVDAVNERKLAAGMGAPFAAVNGDDVQAATFFTAYQQWIEDNYGSFVVSHDGDGNPLAGGCYNNTDAIPVYASLAEVFDATGLAHANWRRYTTHPDDAGVVAYGQMQAGDIIGPWIFEDIQKCLNVLVWTKASTAGWQGGDDYDGVGSERGPLDAATWAAAKAKAEANWARIGDAATHPFAVSRGWTVPYIPPTYFTVYARLSREAGYAFHEDIWNGVVRYVDWYIKTLKGIVLPSVFDSYGDDVIENKYSLWLQDEPATDATTIVSSAKISDASVKPNAPWCDPFTETRGWMWEGDAAVIRWNVSGGFTYV